jgi:putative hydrolase of the HAD superfamily
VADARPQLIAVVFDAGGTLVRLDFEWMSEWLTREGHALDAAALRRAEVEGRRRYDASAAHPHPGDGPNPPLGRAGDTREYFGGMLDAAGVTEPLRTRALEAFLRRQSTHGLWTRPMEGARDALDRLAASGARLACVSNSDGRAEWHLERTGTRAGLEFVVDSQIVGVEKPDPRIFQIALERLGVAAAEALYVGDIRCVDEAGSRAAGMHFVLIDPLGDYGAPNGPSIRGMEELPRWIDERFELRPAGSGTPHAARTPR